MKLPILKQVLIFFIIKWRVEQNERRESWGTILSIVPCLDPNLGPLVDHSVAPRRAITKIVGEKNAAKVLCWTLLQVDKG